MHLLVIEDDLKLARVLARGLSEEEFAVEVVHAGPVGLERLATGRYDLCILDVLLPELGGFEVLKQARAGGDRTPVLMLTAKDSVADRVRGLDSGADDYLVKPFAFAELLARIRALLRRKEGPKEDKLRCGELELDVVAHSAQRGLEPIVLSQKQFALLTLLMRHRGHVVSRGMILKEVFGYGFDPGTNIVDVHISNLRQRIDREDAPSLIQTVRGLGYRMEAK